MHVVTGQPWLTCTAVALIFFLWCDAGLAACGAIVGSQQDQQWLAARDEGAGGANLQARWKVSHLLPAWLAADTLQVLLARVGDSAMHHAWVCSQPQAAASVNSNR